MKKKMKHPVHQGKKPQLIAPVNALDERTAEILYKNQKVLIDKFLEFSRVVLSLKRNMHKEVGKIIDDEIESRFTLMEFCLREIRLFAEILVEKGMASQEEISKKRDEIRKEKGAKNG